MKLMSIMLALSLTITACSSKKKKKEVADVYAEQENMDVKKYRYFSFETEPKVNREIACNLAKANVRSDIAGEITTFIQKSLGASQEGQAAIDANNPKTAPMREFVENTLAEKVQ